MAARRVRLAARAIVVAAALVPVGQALAQEQEQGQEQGRKLTIVPRLALTETYTDNVFLTGINRQEDYITTASPGIDILRDGARFDLSARYTLNYLYFANADDDDLRHDLIGEFASEIVEDRFFLDGSASVNQQFLDRSGPHSFSAGNITENRATIQNYQLSPYFVGRAGQLFDWELRYRGSYFLTGRGGPAASPAGNLSDSLEQTGSATLRSGDDFQTLGWVLTGTVRRFDRSNGRDFEDDVGRLDLTYRLSRTASIVGSIGYERTNFQTIAGDREGTVWNAGLDFRPSRRSTLTGRYGRRIGDEVFSGGLTYQLSPRVHLAVQYSDEFQTSQGVLSTLLNSGGIVDGVLTDPDGVPLDVGSPGFSLTDEGFRRKLGSGSVAFTRPRGSLTLTGSWERRIFAGGTVPETSYGGTAAVSRQLSRKASIGIRGSYRRLRQVAGGIDDDYYEASARYDYLLAQNVTLYLQGFRSERSSSDTARKLTENGGTIGLAASF